MSILGIGVLLILAGLGICFLSSGAGKLATVFWWIGIIVAILGGLLTLLPAMTWVTVNLKQALGIGDR